MSIAIALGSGAQSASITASLKSFFAAWTGPLFPQAEQQEMRETFSFLIEKAFADSNLRGERRSNLCADGTPLEMSLALDDGGRFAVRFVCDVTDGDVHESLLTRSYRELADHIIPPHEARATALDWVLGCHLAGASEMARFRVWYGAGFSPGCPKLGKLYFNTEWLSSAQVHDVLAPFLTPAEIEVLASVPLLKALPYAVVGYDFDHTGLRKLKVYVRPSTFASAPVLRAVEHFCADRLDNFQALWERVTGVCQSGFQGSCVVSVGILPQQHKREVKVYLHLTRGGIGNFVAAAPLLQAALSKWGLPVDGLDSAPGPVGCEPTLFAFGVDDDREMVSLYFKPALIASS